MKTITAFATALVFLALAACTSTPVPIAGVYIVAEINGEQVFTDNPIKVTYTGDRLSGRGPINTWNFPVDTKGVIGIGTSTKMAGSPELMQTESSLMSALNGAKLKANADGVILIEKDGKVVVELTPINAANSTSDS